MRNIVALIWLFSTTFNASLAAKIYGECLTPKGKHGVCVEIKECAELFALVSPDISDENRELLIKSQCRHESDVLVCCPEQSGNLLPKPPECGTVPSDGSINSNEVKINEHPWLALIEYTKPNKEKNHYCAGTLINERYVLAAAHCVVLQNKWRVTAVRLGEWDTSTNSDLEKGVSAPPYQDIPVEAIIPHKLFGALTTVGLHNIALIRLARKVTFSNFIKPICLPTEPSLESNMFVNENLIVAGWGRTDAGQKSTRKLKATLTVKNLDECQKSYLSTERAKIVLNDSQLCAGGEKGAACKGDSGGPLIALKTSASGGKAHFLVGVLSLGLTSCDTPGWPSVYTRVGAYMDWIKNTMQD